MKKLILISTIFLSCSLFVSCGLKEDVQKNTANTLSEYNKENTIKDIEEKFGLANLYDKSLDELTFPHTPKDTYLNERKEKLNLESLNEETIIKAVERALLLLNDNKFEEPKYELLYKINEADRLDYFISDELALKLLENCLNLGDINELEKLIDSDDPKIYYFSYVQSLLIDYYFYVSPLPREKIDMLIMYLPRMKSLIEYKARHPEYFESFKSDCIKNINEALSFLELMK